MFQHLTASQGTAVETLRVQLAAANERINKLSADVHEKKSGYRHSQLEELRNLQVQFYSVSILIFRRVKILLV